MPTPVPNAKLANRAVLPPVKHIGSEHIHTFL
uniref:Uncharacterized protein n=1 Tax=Tetraselmis sp. GSL018 TaxID=582737 RepID=A0A061RT94_9CHLO